MTYYNLVADSDGDNALNFKYVKAFGFIKPFPFGFCEHGPVRAAHHVRGHFFWPPILKRVCARLCPFFDQRCRASCCETECVFHFVWRCTGGSCIRLGWNESVIVNTTAASVHAVSPPHSASCELNCGIG